MAAGGRLVDAGPQFVLGRHHLGRTPEPPPVRDGAQVLFEVPSRFPGVLGVCARRALTAASGRQLPVWPLL